MNNELTSGKCRLCDQVFGKRQMTNHLKACWKHHTQAAPGKVAARWFHLVVDGRYSPDYWLHLQAPANSTFGALDSLLRRVWLECCGHLSAFRFPAKRKRPRHGTPFDLATLIQEWGRVSQSGWDDDDSDDALMRKTLGSKLSPGVGFSHEYDFGSTTRLALRVAGEHGAPALAGGLKLLARNDPPADLCSVCGKPATQLCPQCVQDGEGALCDSCADQHDCGEDMLLPLINSPRAGVCGYCGPSVEP